MARIWICAPRRPLLANLVQQQLAGGTEGHTPTLYPRAMLAPLERHAGSLLFLPPGLRFTAGQGFTFDVVGTGMSYLSRSRVCKWQISPEEKSKERSNYCPA